MSPFLTVRQVCLILLAAFIYRSTTFGFGLRVVDIQRTGGSIPKAMQVSESIVLFALHSLEIQSLRVKLGEPIPLLGAESKIL